MRELTALVLVRKPPHPHDLRVEDVPERFGANVRALRHAREWTQEDLAAHSGLAVVQISRIERGVREVRLGTVVRLLRAFDTSPAEILDGLY